MCQFIETIKYLEGQFYYLEYHQERLNRTFVQFFSNKSPFDLSSVLKQADKPNKGFYRCRVVYDSEIQKIEFVVQQPREIKTLNIVTCDTIDYSFKYLNRDLIQKLSKQRQSADDILIIKNGLVTDTSIGNIIFYDGAQWITPVSPLLAGTARARLLSEGLIKERKVTLDSISKYQAFQIVNALLPFNSNISYPIKNIRHE